MTAVTPGAARRGSRAAGRPVRARRRAEEPVMFHSFEDAQSFVRENAIEMVDLKFCDLWGRWHT